MPLYEFQCKHCGADFTAIKSIARRDEPEPCPACKETGERVIVSAPRTTILTAEVRNAHETNERSRHAPANLDQYKSRHGSGCSCCSGGSKKSSPPGQLKRAGSRPWMISH